jgi:hypothetical protein
VGEIFRGETNLREMLGVYHKCVAFIDLSQAYIALEEKKYTRYCDISIFPVN